MNYQVRSKKGGIDLQTSDYKKAYAFWVLAPNGTKLMEYDPAKGWVPVKNPSSK